MKHACSLSCKNLALACLNKIPQYLHSVEIDESSIEDAIELSLLLAFETYTHYGAADSA